MDTAFANRPVQMPTGVHRGPDQQLFDAPVPWSPIRTEDLSGKARADILYVDEQLQIQEIMATYFRHNGLSVITACSADVAMRLAEEWQVEVVVIDADFAGSNGIQLMHYLQANHPATPIVLRTISEQFLAQEDTAAGLGATCCISKTESPAALLATVLAVRST